MSLPISAGFQSVSITGREAIDSSQSANLRTQVQSRGAQRWEFQCKYPPLTRAEEAEVSAFLFGTGIGQTFTMTLPVYSDARGTASGTVRVDNASGYAFGTSTLAIDGLTGTLLKGDFVKFAGHSKVYRVKEDRSGSGDLDIYPSLRTAVADNEVITYDSVPFTVRINRDVHSYSVDKTGLASVSLNVIEAV